jgi:leucyl-tRNA synthetase
LVQYGADTVRAFLMFFARWDQGGPWNSRGIEGSSRWLRRVWNLFMDGDEEGPAITPEDATPIITGLRRKLHQTLRQVTADFEAFSFNTVVAALMELLNEMMQARAQGGAAVVASPAWGEAKDVYVRMLAPVAPHMAEELWQHLGRLDKDGSVHRQPWPAVDEEAAQDEEVTLVVQVNGKVRDRITVPAGIGEAEMKERALASEIAQRFLAGLTIRKVIVVPGRLVNIVAG